MFQVIAENLDFPEGALWSARDGCLYLVEWLGDRVRALRGGRLETLFATPPGAGPSGLGQDLAGNFWVCLYTGLQLAQFSPAGEVLRTVKDFQGVPFKGPNDLVMDAEGGVYFTDGGNFTDDWASGRPAGAVYHLTARGDLRLVDRNICYPNGMALSLDGQYLLVNEHRQNRTLKYRVQADGTCVAEGVFHTFDDTCLLEPEAAFELGPDGMGLDQAGRLWVAHYGGGKVVGLNPDGQVVRTLHLPEGRKPTNVAYHPGEKALYITEAELGLLYRAEID
jgi:gluconolactonase